MQSSEPEQLSEKPANEVVEAPQEVDPHLQPERNGPIERSTSDEEQAIGPDTPAADSASQEMLGAKDALATDAINDGGKTFKTKDSADVENIAVPEEIRSESDSSREPSVPEVNVIPEISEATVANPEEIKESSRPSSPWVHSYSVSVQGSPSVSAHPSPLLVMTDLPESEAPRSVVLELSEELVNPPSVSDEIATPDVTSELIEEPSLDSMVCQDNSVAPAERVTESLSETSLELSSESTEDVAAQGAVQDETVDTVSTVEGSDDATQTVQEYDSKQETDTPVLNVPDEQATDVPDIFSKDTAFPEILSPSAFAAGIERPRSPWGSYEVTNQSPSAVNPVVEDVEAIAPASFISEIPVAQPASEPAFNDLPKTEDATVPMASSELTVDTTGTDLPERPKSPWTPSYSVTRQGSQIFNEVQDQLGESEQLPQGVESSTVSPRLSPFQVLLRIDARMSWRIQAFPLSKSLLLLQRDRLLKHSPFQGTLTR
ncbi:hypothetical protein GGU10DRAFT_156352 [Lentinula aff. detonsa]|uniref:Uncharacterized protein n=1 Tax=Lentinula aff. detonsa TaxID=2804958 RepID=A0AA38L5A3_9AGAR|nr:hypothetical protein GGU10DRAFT_156352 [Lentinula aff. detonsa]